DSNVSSLITSLILFALGTQSVKGFALTLGLGIILSMFSAITVTRTFLRALEFREGRKIRILYGAR
ncbi:MAG TPA: protein translocase subunit SecD, partial [Candidatus Paceibacterota bacterium]